MALRTSIWIDLAGNMQQRASQLLQGMQRLGHGGAQSMHVLHRSIEATGRGLDRLGNRYTAILSGAAGLGAVKSVGDMSMRLTRLGINAETDAQTIYRLWQKIMDTAQMKDVRVDPGEMLSGVEKIIQKLGDLGLATDNLRTLGIVLQASGSSGSDVGDMLSNLRDKFGLANEEMLTAFAILSQQGHAASFEFKDMVTQGNRITAAYSKMGRIGIPAIREMGAMMQVFMKSAGSPEEVATAWKNVFQDLMEPGKQKYLKALNISIWDPEKQKQGKKQMRSIVDIFDELLVKMKGDPEKFQRIFGMQAMDGIAALLSHYQKTGKNLARDFLNLGGDVPQLLSESARAAKEFNSSLQHLHTSWIRFANNNLAGPIQKVADALNSLDPKRMEMLLKVSTGVVAVAGAAILGRMGYKGYQWGRDLFKGGKGGPGMPGGLPGAGGPIPVYVTNFPGSIPNLPKTPPAPLPTGKVPGGVKLPGWMGKAGVYGMLALGVGSAAYAGYDALRGGSGKNWVSDWQERDYLKAQKDKNEFFSQLGLLSKPNTPLAGSNRTEVGGTIKIEVQDNRVAVKEIRASNPDVDLDVETGLMMRSH